MTTGSGTPNSPGRIPALLLQHFGDDLRASQLSAFLDAELARPAGGRVTTAAVEDDVDDTAHGLSQM